MMRYDEGLSDEEIQNYENKHDITPTMKNRLKNEDHRFAVWGADNWDTLEEMTEDCSSFTGKTQSIEEFALYMWHNGQDLVEHWKEIKHNRILANN